MAYPKRKGNTLQTVTDKNSKQLTGCARVSVGCLNNIHLWHKADPKLILY